MFPFTTAARSKPGPTRGASGRAAMLDDAPALPGAVDLVLARLVKGLQAMAGAATMVEGAVVGFASETAASIVASHRPEGAAALLECPALGGPMVATLDATLVHALVELLCGGNGVEPPCAGRPATAIDRQFTQIVFGLIASAIQTEWASFGFDAVKAVRVEAGLAVDVFGPRSPATGIVDLTIGVFGLHGTLRLALPSEALERFRDASREVGQAAAASDPIWSELLRREIGQAPVVLAAYLDAKPLTLGALSELKVGQILAMPADARTRAALVGDGRTLYRGEIGQAEGYYSLRVDEVVAEPPQANGRAPQANGRAPQANERAPRAFDRAAPAGRAAPPVGPLPVRVPLHTRSEA